MKESQNSSNIINDISSETSSEYNDSSDSENSLEYNGIPRTNNNIDYDSESLSEYISSDEEDFECNIKYEKLTTHDNFNLLKNSNIDKFYDDNKSILNNQKNILFTDFESKNVCEKNWAFFTNNENELNCVYQWYPITICNINKTHFKISKSKVINTPTFFKNIYGSTPGFILDNEIWFIVHKKNLKKGLIHILIIHILCNI